MKKNKAAGIFTEEALAVKKLAEHYKVPLIIDDRIDVALAVDADGVHVGQSDLPVFVARNLLGPNKIVGATAKTVEQALEAQRQGSRLSRDGRHLSPRPKPLRSAPV